MEKIINKLTCENDVEFADGLLEFAKKCETQLTFGELNEGELRKEVWQSLFERLNRAKYFTVHRQCLQVLRILSRDKTDLNELITPERLNVVLKNAGLHNAQAMQKNFAFTDVTAEALKLLCNLLYNSTSVPEMIGDTSCPECAAKRVSFYRDDDATILYGQIKLFDARVLFLATALNPKLRSVVGRELGGITHLTNMLDKTSAKIMSVTSRTRDDDVALACEILKVLFNLYIDSEKSDHERDDNENLGLVLYNMLVDEQCERLTKREELQSNIVNLLTAIPYSCYDSIIQPNPGGIDDTFIYENTDMRAVDKLLKFLDDRLERENFVADSVSPILSALVRLVKTKRLIRKYTRLQVLPPLKDVMKRPEEGSSLRAKLCKLLTCPKTELCDLVAEFIFVICKENVNRMVKYTGYGNAAGMFANKGLLGKSEKSSNSSAYSSESEDSDTEEYVKHKENINPVTGCYEHPKQNPLEGMTEEQKEYEAMKLVSLVDQLTRQGIVQPCRIGQDGKPKPIEHILELQEQLPNLTVKCEKTD